MLDRCVPAPGRCVPTHGWGVPLAPMVCAPGTHGVCPRHPWRVPQAPMGCAPGTHGVCPRHPWGVPLAPSPAIFRVHDVFGMPLTQTLAPWCASACCDRLCPGGCAPTAPMPEDLHLHASAQLGQASPVQHRLCSRASPSIACAASPARCWATHHLCADAAFSSRNG